MHNPHIQIRREWETAKVLHRPLAVSRAIDDKQDAPDTGMRRADHQYRAGGVLHHLLGYTTQKDAERCTQSFCAKHD
jgi:hypothetical protein